MISSHCRAAVILFACLCWVGILLSLLGCGGTAVTAPPPPPLENPVPSITSLSPASTTAGAAAFNLTVNGTNFIASSQVLWNGSARTTSFQSSTVLTAQITASDVSTQGTAAVTVTNPAPGGGTSNSSSFQINAVNPVPSITSLSPASTTAGAAAFNLTVNGTNFIASSQVLWNGSARTTSFQSSTVLTAQITASDVGTQGVAAVTVTNPAPGGGTSNSSNFQINSTAASAAANLTVISLQGNDLVWDPQQKKIYVSVPGTSTANPNSIAVIDPISGTTASSHSVGSNPGALAISDDGQFLYAGITGTGSLQRFVLPSFTADISWNFGTDPNFHELYYAGEIKVAPGAPHTVAISRWLTNVGPRSSGVLIYDDATPRPNIAIAGNDYDSIQWKSDATALYSQDTEDTGLNFYVLSVNSTGISQVTSFGSRFRYFGDHLHLDPATGYVYSDTGEVLDSGTSLPVGMYPANPGQAVQLTMAAVDPALGRVFFLSPIQGPSGNSFQIDVFDQKHFLKLGSILVPNAVGTPANFIRWGTSGLAFVTNDPHVSGGSAGQLYLLDGPFVNPVGPSDTTIGSTVDPLPTLTSVNPPSVPVGSSATQITIGGLNFNAGSVAQWNGQAVATTFNSQTQLQFTVPAASLAAPASVRITVVNPTPGGGTSNSLPVTVDPAPASGNQIAVFNAGGNDLAWNSQQQKFYVSVPGVNTIGGNAIVSVDPVNGLSGTPLFVGSEPAKLSISSDDQFLYVGMNGSNSIQQLALPALTSATTWHLGADDFDGPFYPLDMKVAPGSPHTTAVTRGTFNVFPAAAGGIVIYDDSTARPTIASGFGTAGGNEYDALEWGVDVTSLFAAGGFAFYTLTVNQQGVSLSQNYQSDLSAQITDVHFDSGTGLIYADTGQVIDPKTGKIVSTIGASGLVIPDSARKRIYLLGQTAAQVGTANYTIESFDETTFAPVSSTVVSNVVGVPTAFVLWGTSGLAFTTEVRDPIFGWDLSPGRLYVVSGPIVTLAANPLSNTERFQPVQKTWGGSRLNRLPSIGLRSAPQ